MAITTSETKRLDPAYVSELEDRVTRLTERLRETQREQEMWVQVEKEAAVGRLARGLAHEINNPLQGVLGFVQLLMQKLQTGELEREQALQNLEWVESSALRCKRIIDAMLDFAARGEGKPMVVDILGLLELNLVLLEGELEERGSALSASLPDQPISIRGNPSQVTQALFNVLVNARDAVSAGGVVFVEVVTDDHDVSIRITDDGPGIPEENLRRIFDPFFSTKEVGQGTGLGLCAARGIVRLHGGEISVTNLPGGGARVSVTFPRYVEDDESD